MLVGTAINFKPRTQDNRGLWNSLHLTNIYIEAFYRELLGTYQTMPCRILTCQMNHHLSIKRSASTSSVAITFLEDSIKRLVSERSYDQAFNFYAQHVHPSQLQTSTAYIVPSIARACANSRSHQILGLQLHCNVLKNGLDSEFTVSNSLLTMYGKYSDTESAVKLFDEMPSKDTVSWNSMINCFTQNGFVREALDMFMEMYRDGFVPKPELVAGCLSSCAENESWRLGRAMHALVFLDERIDYSCFLASALLDFYWKFGDPDTAVHVFDRIPEKNVVAWTSMICGWIEYGDYNEAFSFLRKMQNDHIKPNVVTLIIVLPACADLRPSILGKEIHAYAIHHGCDLDPRFSSALLHMYCESGGALHIARLIFERSVKREIVMWSSMIAGYSRSRGSAREALKLFNQMQTEGILPNSVTLLGVISACANLPSLSDGCGVHGYSLKAGFLNHLAVQNAFINMYSKCGSLRDSVQVFSEVRNKDCISWSALISAYGLYGYAEEALRLFYELPKGGIKADGVAYLVALNTCNHAGLVDEGLLIFEQALKDSYVSLTVEHYACYIDLLGRAGKLQAAYEVVRRMQVKPSPRALTTIVSACKLHGRLDIAESLAQLLVNTEPENAANHTLLSMIYAESGNWFMVEEIRRYMKETNIRKSNSFSKI